MNSRIIRITCIFPFLLLLLAGLPALAQSPQIMQAHTTDAQLQFDQKFYSSGDLLAATLSVASGSKPYNGFVVFVSTKTGDAEGLQLEGSGPLFQTSGKLEARTDVPAAKNDGILSVAAGEVITVYYYNYDLKTDKPKGQAKKKADIVADFAWIRSENLSGKNSVEINKQFALSKEEANQRAVTVLSEGGLPIQVHNSQVIVNFSNQTEAGNFQKKYGAKIIANTYEKGKQSFSCLVEVPLDALRTEDYYQLRSFLGMKNKVYASNENALKLILFCAIAQLEGYNASLNPRLRFYDDAAPSPYMANPPASSEPVPSSFTDPFTNVVKVWNYLAIFDKDRPTTPVRVGIVDYGFANNNDYRNSLSVAQCAAAPTGVTCGPNAAQGPPTIGEVLGDRNMYHGNACQARSCGVLNNNFGTAGVGGQVGEPVIVKMTGVDAYAFNMGGGIRAAVDRGASVINLSGGYPCRALTSLGDFNYCEPAVRGAICAALFPIVEAGTVLACSALGWIPFAGPALVATCIGGASAAYISGCTAQFALGNPAEPLQEAIQYAKSRGVPVVVSAGNIIRPNAVPEVLRGIVNLDQNRMTVEDWNVIPANLPDVICVGAANAMNYSNTQCFGNKVDIWAPEDGFFMSPESSALDRGFNGTSAAAPFITGLVAAAMAVNPELNPSTSTRSSSIVDEVRRLLTATAWVGAPLPADPTNRRRNLVNPIAFIKAVANTGGSTIPFFAESVYGNNWNVDNGEEPGNDAQPIALRYLRGGIARTGAIIHIPGADGAAPITDRDFYRMEVYPTEVSDDLLTIRLRTPVGRTFGNLVLNGTGFRLTNTTPIGTTEEEKTYTGPSLRMRRIEFSIEGADPTQDNIYLLSIGNVPAPIVETPTEVNIQNIGTLCPTRLTQGDREFGGGPLINSRVELRASADNTGIDAHVYFKAEETGGDRTTVEENFAPIRVYTAPAANRIVRIEDAFRSAQVVNYRGAGAGAEISIGNLGCNEGVVATPPVVGAAVNRITVVGDSGGPDVASSTDCRCDAKIKEIRFNPIRIVMAPR